MDWEESFVCDPGGNFEIVDNMGLIANMIPHVCQLNVELDMDIPGT